jgi:glycosyltransferase involved in cell wall biosynthesis
MEHPKVSVIIPSYNRFDSLLNAVESVEAQNYENIEIIVVNDGSTDENYKNYKFNKTVKIVHLENNQKKVNGFGPGAIRNFGTEVADGKYLAFLDDDDLWLPNKLLTQITSLEKSHHKFSSTEGYYGGGSYAKNNKYPLYNKEYFFKDIKHKYKKSGFFKKNTFPLLWDAEFMKIHNCVITSSVVVEREIFNILGGFRGLPRWADYDCWLGLIEFTKFIYIDEPLFYYDGNHKEGQHYYK